MQLNYADMMAIAESIRHKTDNPEFTKLERDTLLFALGLLSARAPGKLEPKIETVLAVAGKGPVTIGGGPGRFQRGRDIVLEDVVEDEGFRR